MREHPILMSGEMIRAILDGRKTQTRRVMNPQPPEWVLIQFAQSFLKWPPSEGNNRVFRWGMNTYSPKCRYGRPGHRLWVRETWHTDTTNLDRAQAEHEDAISLSPISYRADTAFHSDLMPEDVLPVDAGWCWRPSIHMPRWASRLMLEVVSVKVERIKDISPMDCIAEGITRSTSPYFSDRADDERTWFRDLWDSINAKRGFGWDVNPWVWVVEFKKVNE